MVYGFAKQSGGHIKVYSEPDAGTTFRLYLPRSTMDEDARTERDVSPIVGGTETILVAEDDDAVRETTYHTLLDLGYRVLPARDAASALAILQGGAKVDLLFTDVVMPGPLKSTELARRARELLPGIVVLFTSGYTENSIVHGGRLDPGVQLHQQAVCDRSAGTTPAHVAWTCICQKCIAEGDAYGSPVCDAFT